MIVNYLALGIAIMLSFVAAYYSIAGLAVIFSAAMIPVVVMASTLEAGKVVAASWLYRNWDTAPRFIKYYLTVAVVVLMFITSMGIFGFLSKAHLDQTINAGDTGIELKLIDQQIQNEQRRLENAQKSLSALDRLVDQSDTQAAINLRNRQERERKLLASEINAASASIKDLNTKALPLRKENLKLTAEVGPIKYIADLIYGDSAENVLEKAVRAVILTLVFVFDPLAIMLLLAANHSLSYKEDPVVEEEEEDDQKEWLDFFDKGEDHGNCPKCNTRLAYAEGIGPFCPNKKCDVVDATVGEEVVQKEIKDEPVEKEDTGWSARWYQQAKGLISKKKQGTIEIDQNEIVRMK